jgi:hypothetical protein
MKLSGAEEFTVMAPEVFDEFLRRFDRIEGVLHQLVR